MGGREGFYHFNLGKNTGLSSSNKQGANEVEFFIC